MIVKKMTKIMENVIIMKRHADKKYPRVAIFDLDGTLAKTKSKKKFPTTNTDIMLWHKCVPDVIREIPNDALILIYTNQAGLSNDEKVSDFLDRLDIIIDLLGMTKRHYCVIAALKKDDWRKPCIYGMFDRFYHLDFTAKCEILNGIEEVFMVGDAAGRPSDHADTDRKFARNISMYLGIDCPFYTPEQYFLGKPEEMWSYDGLDLDNQLNWSNECYPIEPKGTQEIVLLIGPPGSGKSTIYEQFFSGYIHINRDTLGKPDKCVAKLIDALEKRSSAVIDATHPSKESRARYITIARSYNVPIRFIRIDCEVNLSLHQVKCRKMGSIYPRSVPDIAVHKFFSSYEEPTSDEYNSYEVYEFRPNTKVNPHFWFYSM